MPKNKTKKQPAAERHTPKPKRHCDNDDKMSPSYVWVRTNETSTTTHQAELLEILTDGYLVRWTTSNREQKLPLTTVLEQDDTLGPRQRRTSSRHCGKNRALAAASSDNEEGDNEDAEEEEDDDDDASHVQDEGVARGQDSCASTPMLTTCTPAKKQRVSSTSSNKENREKEKEILLLSQQRPLRKTRLAKLLQAEEDQQAATTPSPTKQPAAAGTTMGRWVSLFQLHKISPTKAAAKVAQVLQSHGYQENSVALFVTEFFLFAHERHLCWQRRNNDSNPQWSQSPILQNYNFANVYRALDRGTCFARFHFGNHYLALCRQQQQETEQRHKNKNKRQRNLFSMDQEASCDHGQRPCTKLLAPVRRRDWIQKLLWTSYCYRQVNQMESFLNYGGIPSSEQDLPRFLKHVERVQEEEEEEQEESIFFAPSTTGSPSLLSWDDYKDHLKRVAATNGWILKSVAGKLAQCKTLQECFEQICDRLPGMNEHQDIAWQILCDLLEAGCWQVSSSKQDSASITAATANNHNNNNNNSPSIVSMDLCYLSPESLRTLSSSCWNDDNHDFARAVDLLQLLTEKQNEIFDAIGVTFPAWNDRPLALKDVAHCLSQFCKYLQIQNDMRRQLIGGGHRLLVSRSYLDVEKKCRFCDLETDNGLFCDACLEFYCSNCESESCRDKPDHWMCAPCAGMNHMQFSD